MNQEGFDPEPVWLDNEEDDLNIILEDGTEAAAVDRQWFVIHCYSGYENKVRHAIEQRIETMGMRDKIFDVIIPTEEEIEIRDGKHRPVERRVFPGYLLVEMVMDEDSWYVVRNTPGVTGFVGMGNDPTPLREEEVIKIMDRMSQETPTIDVNFSVGKKVRSTGRSARTSSVRPFDSLGSTVGADASPSTNATISNCAPRSWVVAGTELGRGTP